MPIAAGPYHAGHGRPPRCLPQCHADGRASIWRRWRLQQQDEACCTGAGVHAMLTACCAGGEDRCWGGGSCRRGGRPTDLAAAPSSPSGTCVRRLPRSIPELGAAASLPRCSLSLPRYLAASLPRCLAASLPRCLARSCPLRVFSVVAAALLPHLKAGAGRSADERRACGAALGGRGR